MNKFITAVIALLVFFLAINDSHAASYTIRGEFNSTMANKFEKQRFKGNVTLVIYSGGGRITAMNKMLRKMHRSSAQFTCVVPRFAGSAAVILLFNCDKVYIHPQATIAMHSYRLCLASKCVASTKNRFRSMYREYIRAAQVYLQYLTPSERQEISKGRDVLVSGADMMHRIKRGNSK